MFLYDYIDRLFVNLHQVTDSEKTSKLYFTINVIAYSASPHV